MEEEQRGQLIMQLREARLWTREELAKRAGLSPTTVMHAESGRTRVQLSTVRKLAEALDVDPLRLLHPEEAESPKAQAPSRNPRDGALLGGVFTARTMRHYGVGIEGLSEEERKERVYGPIRDYVNDRVDDWESGIAAAEFDQSSADKIHRELQALVTLLGELERFEISETPPEERGENNSNLILNRPIWRLIDFLPKAREAYKSVLDEAERERLWEELNSVEHGLTEEKTRGSA